MSGGQPGATAIVAGPAACGSGKRLALGGLLFLVCLQVYAFVAGMGWSNTILDAHGFRQTQTALTTYFMIGQAPKLAYETPVLGPPWSIPLELYTLHRAGPARVAGGEHR
jgi:hypothetical protein